MFQNKFLSNNAPSFGIGNLVTSTTVQIHDFLTLKVLYKVM